MASMSWTWENLWNWFEQIEEPKIKSWMINQILDIKWLQRLSVDGQVDVMSHAPFEITKWLKKLYPDCLKSDTVSILNEMIKQKYKLKRKGRR